MFVLGIQGSPRKKGNSDYLLDQFLSEARAQGARTHTLDACRLNIEPCKELVVCEKKGICPIQDDMDAQVYPLLRAADAVIVASPIFFYNVTAQLKALIDRSQTLWARKYMLKLTDPGRRNRRGFMLSVAATAGKQLFDGMNLTVQYFFDAIGASFDGALTYRRIEKRGDMKAHPQVHTDVAKAVQSLLKPMQGRKRVLFACRENACRSQMAGAWAQYLAGDRLAIETAGSAPAATINPDMEKAMAEKGIDMAFRRPQSMEAALAASQPEIIVTMGCGEQCPAVPGARHLDWDLPDPAGQPYATMQDTRDRIEAKVRELIDSLA